MNEIFDDVFKFEFAKSGVPSGSELMARTGLRDNTTKGPGRTGRPPNPPQIAIERQKLNVDPAKPHQTALSLDENDSNQWLAGSVVRVDFHDGTEQSVVLLNDVEIVPWIDE